jgi:hypothetical protein
VSVVDGTNIAEVCTASIWKVEAYKFVSRCVHLWRSDVLERRCRRVNWVVIGALSLSPFLHCSFSRQQNVIFVYIESHTSILKLVAPCCSEMSAPLFTATHLKD